MARPAKPSNVIEMEGVSHRTKAELEARRKGEQALLTGKKMREAADVKTDPFAHAMWKRVYSLLAEIGKNDALYEAVINRYCRMASEENDTLQEQQRLERMARICDEQYERGEIEAEEYYGRMGDLIQKKAGCRAMLMRQRKMMMDIEKENVMTIAAALRAVPKTPADDAAADDPMAAMLNKRMMR